MSDDSDSECESTTNKATTNEETVDYGTANYDSVDSDMRKYALNTFPGIMGFCDVEGWREGFSYKGKEKDNLAWQLLEELGIPREKPMPEKPPENDWQRYMQTKGYTESAKKELLFWILQDKIRWHNLGKLTWFETPELKQTFREEKERFEALKKKIPLALTRWTVLKEERKEEKEAAKQEAAKHEDPEMKAAAKAGENAKRVMTEQAKGESTKLASMKCNKKMRCGN
jgi:hypothetical protein